MNLFAPRHRASSPNHTPDVGWFIVDYIQVRFYVKRICGEFGNVSNVHLAAPPIIHVDQEL